MAYKYSFADNEIYSAEDLNSITKRLVTSGIEDLFEDGTAYNVSQFNEQGKLLYTSGIVPETCMTLKVVPDGEGKVLINPGKAFFDDGAVIEIEAGGETLSYVADTVNYVYLKNDLLNSNVCYPICSTEEPSGDYVLLAEINETGEITDKRTYAKGRLPGYQSVVGNVMRIKKTITFDVEEPVGKLSDTESFDLGSNNFEYILAYNEKSGAESGTIYHPCLGIYDIAKMQYRSFYENSDGASKSYTSLVTQYSWKGAGWITTKSSISFEIEEGVLTVLFSAVNADKFSKVTHSFDIDLILF